MTGGNKVDLLYAWLAELHRAAQEAYHGERS